MPSSCAPTPVPPVLGVGLVGSGPVAQAIHLPTLARLSDLFRVAHVMDVNAAVAEQVAGQADAHWSTSIEELLDDPDVEVVAICSPPQFHADQVIAACLAGKRGVLCEKPFTLSRHEADQIAAVSARTGVPVLVGAMHSYDESWIAAREQWGDLVSTAHTIRSSIVLPPNERFEDFATEMIGRPNSAVARPSGPDAVAARPSNPDAVADKIWNAVMGLAIHDLPLVRFFAGDTERVRVLAASFEPPFGYLIVLGVGERTVELRASMSATWAPDWTLDVIADDRALSLNFTPSYVHAGSAIATLHDHTGARTVGPYESNGYEAEWRELASVVGGAAPVQAMTTLIEDLAFALTIADGARSHLRAGRVAA